MIKAIFKNLNGYQFAVILSSLSVIFGIVREFLIVGLLGFSSQNDQLQVYLSIFYSVGLSIDAVRLATLNLYNSMVFRKILICASLIGALFSIIVGFIMDYLSDGLYFSYLLIAIVGSYFNLIAALVITYKQRCGAFLSAQIINVLPNFILIPGILFVYLIVHSNPIFYILILCLIIPILQLAFLSLVRVDDSLITRTETISFLKGILIFIKHSLVMVGEQLFQIFTRAALFKYGHGFLSVLAMSVRVYAAARFVLVDSYIGSRLAIWDKKIEKTKCNFYSLLSLSWLHITLFVFSCVVFFNYSKSLTYFAFQIIAILLFGFYFGTLVRIVYFKINHQEHDSRVVIKFGIYELIFAVLNYSITNSYELSIIVTMWSWYIAKPFLQLFFLRRKSYKKIMGT